jgi:CheY-like chemotaxis protein
MPKMDGLQALVAIRRDSSPKLRGMRVIMCTGAATGREIDESFAAGATDYLPKPIDLKTLFAKVEKTLKR